MLFRRRCFLIVVSLGLACGRPALLSAGEALSIPGLEAAVKPGALALFGDIHGTAEIPAFVGEVACSLARRQRVHVGLELPVADAPLLRAFLDSGDDAALRRSAMWSRAYQDGRTSEAMLALLRRLRDARASGLPIEVFFFDDQDRLGLDRRDEAMAENIAGERSRAPSETFLVEVGNLHAKKSAGAPWDPSKRWMASFLASREPDVLTFDVRAPPGTAWICSSAEADSCGVKKLGTAGRIDPAGRAQQAALTLGGDLDGYDGTFTVGGLTASRPAFAR